MIDLTEVEELPAMYGGSENPKLLPVGAYNIVMHRWNYLSAVFAALEAKLQQSEIVIPKESSKIQFTVIDDLSGNEFSFDVPRNAIIDQTENEYNVEYYLTKTQKSALTLLMYMSYKWTLKITSSKQNFYAKISNENLTDWPLVDLSKIYGEEEKFIEGGYYPIECLKNFEWGTTRINQVAPEDAIIAAPKLARPFFQVIVENAIPADNTVYLSGPSNYMFKWMDAERYKWEPSAPKVHGVEFDFEDFSVWKDSIPKAVPFEVESTHTEEVVVPKLINPLKCKVLLRLVDAQTGVHLGYLGTPKQNVSLQDNKVLSAESYRSAMELIYAIEETIFTDSINSVMEPQDKQALKDILASRLDHVTTLDEDGNTALVYTVPVDTRTQLCTLDVPPKIRDIIYGAAGRSVSGSLSVLGSVYVDNGVMYMSVPSDTPGARIPLYSDKNKGESCFGLAQTTLATYVSHFSNSAKVQATFTIHAWLLALSDSYWSKDPDSVWYNFVSSKSDPDYYHYLFTDEVRADSAELKLTPGRFYLLIKHGNKNHCIIAKCVKWDETEEGVDYDVEIVYDSLHLEEMTDYSIANTDTFRSFRTAVNTVKGNQQSALEYGLLDSIQFDGKLASSSAGSTYYLEESYGIQQV